MTDSLRHINYLKQRFLITTPIFQQKFRQKEVAIKCNYLRMTKLICEAKARIT